MLKGLIEVSDNRKNLLNTIYEIGMSVLAVMVLIILVIEFTSDLSEYHFDLFAKIDMSILVVFALDYVIRFSLARNKFVFFKSNILDLIAIMPFDKAFRLARLARLTRLVRLSRTSKIARLFKLTRLLIFTKKFGGGLMKLLKTNGLNYVILFTFFLIFGGAFGIMLFERQYGSITSFGDALWWSMVTTTTVGYGDLSPVSAGGRILAAILMIVGIGFIGMVTGSIATFFIKKPKENVLEDGIDFIQETIDISSLSQDDRKLVKKYVKFLEGDKE